MSSFLGFKPVRIGIKYHTNEPGMVKVIVNPSPRRLKQVDHLRPRVQNQSR
jgi:hypothetical protein